MECLFRFSRLAVALLVVQVSVHGWVPPPTRTGRPSWCTSKIQKDEWPLLDVKGKNIMESPDDQDEEECYDLCDSEDMPVFDTDELLEEIPSNNVTQGTARLRLEMQWELFENEESCQVLENLESCGDTCTTCHGQGVVSCRFCHGKTILSVGDKAVMCPVCSMSGVESCKACRGSGYIAAWTTMTGGGGNGSSV